MADSVHIDFKGNVLEHLERLETSLTDISKRVNTVEKKAESAFDSMKKSLKNISFVQVTQGLENLNQSLQAINAPGLSFESSMADMSAITGLTGSALEELGDKARANAKEFGGSAAQSVETYKLLLSQLTPELANKPAVLDQMARNVSVLSKTMGGDATAAAEVLTTGMNQYGVSFNDPIQAQKEMTSQMNIMAAGAKEGSAELPALKNAIANVGGDAKRAKLSFGEMVSAIELLDKAGKKGAEGGVALRNTLSTLSQGRFLPKEVQQGLKAYNVDLKKLSDTSIPFTDRLKELRKASHDAALMTKLFGKENALGANALIDGIEAQEKMTSAISNTNTAEEQASVIMETTAEKRARMKAQIDDLKISMFEATGGAFAYLEPLSEMGQVLSGFAPLISGAVDLFGVLKESKMAAALATNIATAAEWALNVAMNANPVLLIVTGVIALTGAVYAATKAFGGMTTSQRNAERATKKANEAIIDEKVQLGFLFDELRDTNTESARKKEIIAGLNKEYPGLLSNYDLEKGKLEDIDDAEQDIIDSLFEKARAAAFFEIAKKESQKAVQEEIDGPGFWDHVLAAATDGMATADQFNQMDVDDYEASYKDAMRQGREIRKKLKEEAKAKSNSSKEKDGLPETDKNDDKDDKDDGKDNPDDLNITASNGTKSKSFSADKHIKNTSVVIQNLMSGDINITNANMAQTKAKIQKLISEALVGAVRDYEVAI